MQRGQVSASCLVQPPEVKPTYEAVKSCIKDEKLLLACGKKIPSLSCACVEPLTRVRRQMLVVNGRVGEKFVDVLRDTGCSEMATDHRFSFPVEDSLDLLGVTIGNHLNFNKHVSLVCKKVNNQLNVIIRFRNLICTATKLKLYNAFILPHFLYRSTVWYSCSTLNCDKLESLNKRALRIVFHD